MPLYEYECQACGHRFEVIQKYSDPLVEVCSTCAGPVQKLVSSPAIKFKGAGWYVNDYAKKDQVTATKSDPGAAAQAPSASGADSSSPAQSNAASSAPAPASPAPSAPKNS